MKKVVMLIAMLTMSLGSMAAAEVWNLNTDMNASINDNGIWSYAYGLGDPNDPNAIPIYENLMDNELIEDALWIMIFPDGYHNPHIWYGALVAGVPDGMHGMKPGWKKMSETGDAQAPAIIRWTAPASIATPGSIDMNAIFSPTTEAADPNLVTVEVYIVKSVGGDAEQRTVLEHVKGVTKYNPLTIVTSCEITAGDTIDFIVGPQDFPDPSVDPGYQTDWIGISINIADEPLPSCPIQLPMDFNWDCYVNLADFAIFAQSWLDCNNLEDPACEQ